jgi:hypothetical protein
MTQLKKVVEPFGEVNVHPGPGGVIRVVATILMEPSKEGAQTGIALDGSGSMRKLFGINPGGGVVSSLFAKPQFRNEIGPVAQQICAYLARTIDADSSTTAIYWATGQDGKNIEVIGDLRAEQAEQHDFKGPRDFGTGTHLLPAVRYFVERFPDAPWGFYVFITDGELFDLEEVKEYSKRLAQEVAGRRRNPVKFVLIGLGADVNEKQMEDLDDLDTGTDIDLWDHKLAAEMRQLQEIFAEVVDRNARVADNGKILDAQGRMVKNYSDTGLPALLTFDLPPGSTFFTLEVNGQKIHQPISDQASAPPMPTMPAAATSAPTTPPPLPAGYTSGPSGPAQPIQQPVSSSLSPAAPAQKEEPAKNAWDEEPQDLELDDLAKSLDLQFESPPDEKKVDPDLQKNDD